MSIVPEEEEVSVEIREDPPSHYMYKIESFSKILEHGINKCESGEFESGGHKWKLVIYPDGNKNKDGEGHISAYLAIADPKVFSTNTEVKAIFTFFIYNQNLDNYMTFRGKTTRFHVLKTEWGVHKLVSHKVFKEPSNGYLVDDNCAFGVEVFVMKADVVGNCMSLFSNSYKKEWKIPPFSTLTNEWSSEEFSDGGRQWKIKLYPQGDRSPLNHNISIFLNLVDSKISGSHEKLLAACNYTITDQVNGKHYNRKASPAWLSTSTSSLGYAEFILLSDLKDPARGFIVKDCCILEVEVTYHRQIGSCSKFIYALKLFVLSGTHCASSCLPLHNYTFIIEVILKKISTLGKILNILGS